MTFDFEYKIKSLKEAIDFRNENKDKTIVFTNGCFDLLHRGHISYLQEAKYLGDYLIVGLNSDESVRHLKGKTRPIVTEKDRAFMLASLCMVDAVVIFNESTPIDLLSVLKPDLHIKGGDYVLESLPEYPTVTAYGGKIKILSFIQGFSTSTLIQKMRSFQ